MVLTTLLALSALRRQDGGTGPTIIGIPETKRTLLNWTYEPIASAIVAEDGLGAVYAAGVGGVGSVRFDPTSDFAGNQLGVYDEPVASNRYRRAPVLAGDAVYAAEGRVPRGSSWPKGLSTVNPGGTMGAGVLAASTPTVFLARTLYPSKRGKDGRSSLYSRLDMDKPNVAGKPWFSSEEFRGEPMYFSFDGKGVRFVTATLTGSVYRSYAYVYAGGRVKLEKGGPLAKLAGWRVNIPGTSLGNPEYVLSRIKVDPVFGRIAVPTGPASVSVVGRDGKVERIAAPEGYNHMAAHFANGRLLRNVYNMEEGNTGGWRLQERLGGRWIDRGPGTIWSASASGNILLIVNLATEKVEVVWVAKP